MVPAMTIADLLGTVGVGLLLLALVVSGSLLSFDKLVLPITLRVHQIVPLLALAFSALSIYLLANGRS